jgi:hypothetical protein
MNLDIAKERERLQAMREAPQSRMEEAIRDDCLAKGSEPREWSDETVTEAYYVLRVYEMGWNAALAQGEKN